MRFLSDGPDEAGAFAAASLLLRLRLLPPPPISFSHLACLILAVLAGAAGATSEVWGASTSEVECARAAACGVDRGGGAFKARARAMEQSEAEAEIAPVLRSDGRRARERDWQERESGRTRRREAQPYGTRFLACGTDELRVGREKSAAASASSDARRSAWSDRARGCSTPRGRACLLLHFSLLLPLVPHLLLPRLLRSVGLGLRLALGKYSLDVTQSLLVRRHLLALQDRGAQLHLLNLLLVQVRSSALCEERRLLRRVALELLVALDDLLLLLGELLLAEFARHMLWQLFRILLLLLVVVSAVIDA
mmetsp:Transcript_49656/g.107573  ORF Transcript_49656/g.107573 Transcript_49656/m.107573 type:complete len:308 (-) Transcript_49656:491-1414(-)